MPNLRSRDAHHLPPRLGRKLAACGETLTEREWAALPVLARQRLEDAPTTTPMERAAFRLLLRWLRDTFPPSRDRLTERSVKH